MTDESYIQLSLEIAKKGRGRVSPNPMVGAILVKNDKIIGAGFHEHFGGNHAEINALKSAKENVEGATLYINLEPCSHHGKTPPCVDALIENRIKKVVIGTLDVNPLVYGAGVRKLKNAGIDVKVGVLENECIKLNKFFFKYITKNLPYITLKAAQTLDGKIADISGASKWISSVPARRFVHNLRNEYDAVLIGSATVKKDDPSLTVRLIEGRNPKRIVIDSLLKLNLNHKLFLDNTDGNLILVASENALIKENKIGKLTGLGVKVLFVKSNKDGTLNLKKILSALARENITSVLVEGGQKIYTSFIKGNHYDDIFLFISPKFLGEGLPVINNIGINTIKKALKLKLNSVEIVGDDLLVELKK